MDTQTETARIQALSTPTGVRKVEKKLWPLSYFCKNTEMREIMAE